MVFSVSKDKLLALKLLSKDDSIISALISEENSEVMKNVEKRVLYLTEMERIYAVKTAVDDNRVLSMSFLLCRDDIYRPSSAKDFSMTKKISN